MSGGWPYSEMDDGDFWEAEDDREEQFQHDMNMADIMAEHPHLDAAMSRALREGREQDFCSIYDELDTRPNGEM